MRKAQLQLLALKMQEGVHMPRTVGNIYWIGQKVHSVFSLTSSGIEAGKVKEMDFPLVPLERNTGYQHFEFSLLEPIPDF